MTCACVRVTTSSEVVHRKHRDEKRSAKEHENQKSVGVRGSSTHLADNVLCGANSVTVAIYLAPTSAGDPERDMHRPGLYHLALYDR